VDDRLKHARLDPALGLLIDRIPGGAGHSASCAMAPQFAQCTARR
jgi:hypothetical protein